MFGFGEQHLDIVTGVFKQEKFTLLCLKVVPRLELLEGRLSNGTDKRKFGCGGRDLDRHVPTEIW